MTSARPTLYASAALLVASCSARSTLVVDAGTESSKRFGLSEDTHGVPPEVHAYRDDWPLPNRDYDNTRASTKASIDSTNVGRLTVAWRATFAAAPGPFGSVTSNALILGDDIYVQDMSSHVYCLDRTTGKQRWMFRHGDPTVGPNGVAVGWGRLYANSGDTGVIALEAATGRELWRFRPALIQSEGVDIQPTLYDGNVYVSTVAANLKSGYLGRSRGVLFALDAVSGQERWRFHTVPDDFWGDPRNNSGGGAWYPPLIDPERDRTYWGTANPGPWPGLPTAPNGSSRPGDNLYTSSLVALAADSGELAWYHQERAHDLFDWDFQNSPVRVRADKTRELPELIIGSGKTGTVVALAADSGELVWRAKVGRHENDELDALPENKAVVVYPGTLGGVLTPLAYAGGRLFVPIVDMPTEYTAFGALPELDNARGALSALDVRTGELIWNVELPAPSYGAATVVNDLVLTSDASGRVYAFAVDDGRELWHFDAPAGINAPLAVADDTLLIPVGLGAAQLIALRLPRHG
ncbi:MAG TPA: PQQ-binding-like beta-propeller repeat protein [Polyangiales bacterium]|nr:PQQ-binding-like beta-propeller repeat protein [Polyangiales bacterium]